MPTTMGQQFIERSELGNHQKFIIELKPEIFQNEIPLKFILSLQIKLN